jgi:hypothetical protein
MAAAPKNVEYYVSRINGYAKNTIRLLPVSDKSNGFTPGDVVIFRLPTNAIIDLHTLDLSFDLYLQNTANAANSVILPRYTQSFVRRIDVTAGGVQVGLGSLNDYGGIWSLLAANSVSPDKTGDLAVLESGGLVNPDNGNTAFPIGSGAAFPVGVNNTYWCPPAPTVTMAAANDGVTGGVAQIRRVISGFLGVLSGSYMRFLDTNLLPDVEIRLTLASNSVIASTSNALTTSFNWRQPRLHMETISFGDSTYEAMVEARLSTGEPIVVPFTNYASFETSTGSGGASVSGQTQFTVATQSLNTVMGTARIGTYDSTALSQTLSSTPQTPYYQFNGCATTATKSLHCGSVINTPSNVPLDQTAPGRYQLTIDSKVYPQASIRLHGPAPLRSKRTPNQKSAKRQRCTPPRHPTIYAVYTDFSNPRPNPQFLADVGDCYQLTKNAFDGAGNNKAFVGLFRDLYPWSRTAFMLAISLDHNSEDALKDRLVSGLNTNGSNIPITWQMTNVAGKAADGVTDVAIRPTVFVEMTSTLMLYPGRVISVIN